MEGDYYDYEKNLSRSFDSSEPRKRQRLNSANDNITTAELKGSPVTASMPILSVASAKGMYAVCIPFSKDNGKVCSNVADCYVVGESELTRLFVCLFVCFYESSRRSVGVS